MLKLQAATTADQFWTAAQALIAQAAPCSTRWLCLRPIRMATAMMLLRETAETREERDLSCKRNHHLDAADAALLETLFARHPAILHFRKNAGLPLVHLRQEELGPASESQMQWPELSAWKFGAALAFWKRKRLQGLLFLHRTEQESDFSETELKALRELHPQWQTALCRIITLRRQQAQKELLTGVLKPLPLPLVLCDSQLKIVCETAAGLEARIGWEQGAERARVFNLSSRRALPPDLADFCRARISVWEGAGPARRAAMEKKKEKLEHPSALRLSAKVQLVRERNFPLSKPFFLFQFEANGAPVVANNLAALSPLSACERKLALLVSEGHSNADISRRLGKSLHTIKAQLHSIFRKLKVKSRSQLIALLMRVSVHLLPFLSLDFSGAVSL
jgi:DNA-binding CsgD family transcriptional regulator